MLYSLIYALAATNGREAALFGKGSELAQDAFGHSFVGDAFPELWFELPLLGEPWFDLHVLTARETLNNNASFSDADVYYPQIFEWFAAQGADVRQLAISHDISSGSIENPAVQLLLWHKNVPLMCDFLDTVEGEGASRAYRAFIKRLPQEWFACYTGLFPSRPAMGVRVECIPSDNVCAAYAQDASLLEEHLQQLGVHTAGTSIIPWYETLSQFPFQIEFQFNIAPDGNLEPVVGLSVRFNQAGIDDVAFSTDGNTGAVMKQLEAWGLADSRWRLLADATFAKKLSRQGKIGTLFFYPAFIKLRWRGGEPFDAKTYCRAGVQVQ